MKNAMDAQAQHTPLPWEVFPNYDANTCSIGHYGKSAPLVNHVCELPDIQSHDAEFIVQACNNHEALVEALSGMYCAGLWSVDSYAKLPAHQRAAIDKARVTLSNLAP